MDWTVRRADAADAARLALVGAATFLDGFAGVIDGDAIVAHCAKQHAPDAYTALLARPDVSAWLAQADHGGAPVGYSILCTADLPGVGEGDWEVKRIYALSRLHGSGIGRALMQPAIDTARKRGAKRLMLGVYNGNARALAFYAKCGFETVGTRRFTVGAQTYDDYVLALSL
ncbi:hypothetical protein GCM10023219_08320 [Stakelama sediminis]|uniref:GNAT superfamily N-acetyltransferase n=1 Tax=Stakelama sediminis TaxID=463200 RepID=A0A840YV84_9SPHN|nr:GNAT family N-acetyltransferase [Stakelama sediminis]MBB5717553.1 GNAT superfamily N-acetyltransferase [Stakelama sediminis]